MTRNLIFSFCFNSIFTSFSFCNFIFLFDGSFVKKKINVCVFSFNVYVHYIVCILYMPFWPTRPHFHAFIYSKAILYIYLGEFIFYFFYASYVKAHLPLNARIGVEITICLAAQLNHCHTATPPFLHFSTLSVCQQKHSCNAFAGPLNN